MMNEAKLLSLKVSDLESTHKGTPNRCMCGCQGTYAYVAANVKEAGDGRGYGVTADVINDAMAARVLRKVQKAAKEGARVRYGSNNASVVIGKTQYVIYPTYEAIQN